MDESKYQLGIRKLPPSSLVALVTVYRNYLLDYQRFCLSVLKGLYSDNDFCKVICRAKLKNLNKIIRDYEEALSEAYGEDSDG